MHVFTRIFSATRAFVFAAAVSGCAVGPDFHSVAAPAINGYTSEPLPAQTASADVIGGLRKLCSPAGTFPDSGGVFFIRFNWTGSSMRR